MNNKELMKIIKTYNLDCSVKEFINNESIQDKVDWDYISRYQKLSEPFIQKFQDKVNWNYISAYQKLSEPFIQKFKDNVNWNRISECQKLSEPFIEKFQDKVDWDRISAYQKLSEPFIQKFKDKIDFITQRRNFKEKSYEQKLKEAKAYAKKHNLKIKDDCLYAFRDHDIHGRGSYNKTLFYEKGKYYQDWHCDMNEIQENSFGLGIWPKGNTPVKVKIKDWGVAVDRDDGKGRVMGFEVI